MVVLLATNESLWWPLLGAFFAMYLVGLSIGGLYGTRVAALTNQS
jgi:hypothetical protein